MPERTTQPLTGLSIFSLIALVVMGVIPIWGLLYFDWNAGQVIVLFWIESLIVGVFTWLRVRDAERNPDSRAEPFQVSSFFLMHYGLFWLVHGVLTWVLLLVFLPSSDGGWRNIAQDSNVWKAVMGLLLLQTMVYWREWARPQAWRGADPSQEIFRPYGRVMALHLAVLIGFWIAAFAGGGREVAIILCVIKLVVDLVLALWAARFRIRFEPLVERS